MSLSIPLVKSEPNESKYGRMISTTFLIVVIVILYYQTIYQYQIDIPINNRPKLFNHSNDLKTFVNAKKIIVYNTNRKQIPVSQIILIETNTHMSYISVKDAKISHLSSDGISLEFNIPNEIMINQIIIDVDQCDTMSNITTTQIDIIDGNNIKVWSNYTPLKMGDRYIYIDIIKPVIKYEEPSNKLCTGLNKQSEYDQENQLNTIIHNYE